MNGIKSQISVIVLVYNMEQFLPKCIESIIGQTYPNLQIILVDGGSTDKSGAICDYYATIDSRIRVINKKECRRGGLQEMLGCPIITGDYLAFVNGGDSIECKMYESMLLVAEEKKADVVYCNINIRSGQETTRIYPFFDNASSMLHSVLRGECRACLYNSLFRTESWKQSNIVGIGGVDDVLEMFYQQIQYLSSNPCMAHVDYPYYNCYSGMSKSLFYENSIPCINATIDFLKNKKLYDIYKRDLFKILVRVKLTFLAKAEYENMHLWTDATKHLPSYPFSLFLNLLYWIFLNTGLLGLKLYKIWNNKLHYQTINSLDIRNTKETIAYILNNRVSVARFGDGEYDLMLNQMANSTYQQQNDKLAMRLKEVLHSQEANLIVCLPYPYKSYRDLTQESFNFIKNYIKNNKSKIVSITPKTKTYYNTNFTRFYIDYKDKSSCKETIDLIKRIWERRDVFIIEGEYSRLGMNNDLLDGCRSVHRILCPATNSWNRYDEILFTAKQLIPNDKDILVLISLGPTATVLAYDLSLSGYQAIDIGHINVEYMWYKMKAQKKTPLPQLYVNETSQHGVPEPCSDPRYQPSVIATIK